MKYDAHKDAEKSKQTLQLIFQMILLQFELIHLGHVLLCYVGSCVKPCSHFVVGVGRIRRKIPAIQKT